MKGQRQTRPGSRTMIPGHIAQGQGTKMLQWRDFMKSPYLVTLAFLLAACSGAKDEAPPAADTATIDENIAANDVSTAPAMPAATVDAPGYMAKAGAGDLWEIESSKALLAKSDNAGVKTFARMMVDQHGKSTAKMKAAAAEAKLDVAPPKLDADQQKMLDEIKAADAASIDAVYLAHQKTAHDAALALHQGYAAGGDTASLKKAASEIVPVVETHRAELGKLAAKA